MKNLTFKEINKDGKEVRQVSITQEQADNFNAHSEKLKKNKDRGAYFTYEATSKKEVKASFVVINDEDYDKSIVIENINSQKFEGVKNIAKNTGVAKVQLAFDGLSEEQKALVTPVLGAQK